MIAHFHIFHAAPPNAAGRTNAPAHRDVTANVPYCRPLCHAPQLPGPSARTAVQTCGVGAHITYARHLPGACARGGVNALHLPKAWAHVDVMRTEPVLTWGTRTRILFTKYRG